MDCENLLLISIPSSLKTIERYIFTDSGIKNLIIPKGLNSFDEQRTIETIYYLGNEKDHKK